MLLSSPLAPSLTLLPLSKLTLTFSNQCNIVHQTSLACLPTNGQWCDPEWHAKIKVSYERLLRTLWYVTRKFDMVRFWERSSPPTGVTAGAPLIILEKFARVRWGRRKRRMAEMLKNGKNGTGWAVEFMGEIHLERKVNPNESSERYAMREETG